MSNTGAEANEIVAIGSDDEAPHDITETAPSRPQITTKRATS